MHDFLCRQQLKYTSHDVQNELHVHVILIIAQQGLCIIAQQIQRAVFFTVMIDETTDCSNKE